MQLFRKTTLLLAILILLSTILAPLPLLAAPLPSSKSSASEDEKAPLDLYAKAAVLMDAESGRILYDKNGQDILPMASTTKIMTCILALEYGNLEDYAITSSYASSMPKVKLYAKQNEYFKLEDLLYSLMLESHNDSAVIIAEHIAGSTQAFADLMNQKARDIGCYDTFFITPNGLDATVTSADGVTKAHSTSAADLAKIMSYCMMYSTKKEDFLKITGTPSYSFSGFLEKDSNFISNGKTYNCNNHNAFLSMMNGALSGKTGFTGNAGYCYVGALRQDNRTFVVALLACGWPNNKSYKWSDTKKLMNYGLDYFEYHTLSEVAFDASTLQPIPVLNGQTPNLGETAYTIIELKKSQEEPSHDRLDTIFDNHNSHGFLLKKGEEFQVDCEIAQALTAPVHVGDQVGTVTYKLNEETIQIEYILAKQDIPAINLPWCLKQILQLYSL